MKYRVESWPYWPRALLFALLACMVTALFQSSDIFRRVEYDLSDAHGRLFARQVSFDNVAVIDVDEDSITKLQPTLGAWPYDREVYALVTQWLIQAGVRGVAFDILFAEPRKGDQAFAAAIDERVVLAAAALPYTFKRDTPYHAQLEQKSWGVAPQSPIFVLSDLTLPIAPLAARANIGVISSRPDPDGTLRRVALVYSAYGRLLPGVGLALWHAGSPVPPVSISAGRVTVGDQSWPVSAEAEVVLRYPKSLDSLRTVPFYQVALAASGVAGLEPLAQSLRGKRVIIGSSSVALGDYVQTPMGREPGVKIQAMAAELVATGQIFKPRSLPWELLLTACVLALVALTGHPRWKRTTITQWAVFPLVVIVVGIFVALAGAAGQALGLLFAICAGFLAHLGGMLYQQVQLYRHNQQLEMETQAAREADRLKTQFLSHMTHELRTPLTAIMGFNNINLHQNDLGREQRVRNGEIIDRNSQNMLTLVNNLLDQAKIEAGQMAIQRQPERVRMVIADVLATVEPLLKSKPVKLRVSDGGVPEWLALDAFRLRQIILNLLSNAIKFTEKGEISVVCTWQDDVLTLAVRDTGAGMPAPVLQRLFGAFQQAGADTAATHGGTGLGLAISLNLARLMGGTIVVDSKVGEGTVFTVTVTAPRAEPESADAPLTATAAQPEGELSAAPLRGTVLVAEDMPDIRALVVRHLKRLGLTVLEAENGKQAVEIALSQRPDAVLMDMDMPVVAGAEATRTLRQCGYSHPILALTAHKGEEERRLALAAGCNTVLAKPLTRGSLQVALAAALATRSTESTE